MVSMLLPAILWNAQQRFLSYFIEQNAFSPQSAVNIDAWLEKLKIKKENLSKLSYIKVTPDGKYWLDKVAYSKLSKETLYIFLAIMIILAIIVGSVIYLTSL